MGRLHSFESHLECHFSVDSQRRQRRSTSTITHRSLNLASTDLKHKRLHHVTWKPPCATQTCMQLGHFAVSRRWRGSIQDCRSFWCTPLESDHAILRARLLIRFPLSKRKQSANQPVSKLYATSAQKYRLELVSNL